MTPPAPPIPFPKISFAPAIYSLCPMALQQTITIFTGTLSLLFSSLISCSNRDYPFLLLPENEQIKHVDSITYAATNAQHTASHAAAEVNFTTSNSCFLGKTREENGAINIQTAYRGYMARRAFRSLRAMMRLKLWIQGQAVKHQTTSTLIRIQTMSRVRSQGWARRTLVAQVNETLQRQLIHTREKFLDKQAFDLSPKSKEQVEAMLKSKKEATERRKKALAYAYSRQQTWRNSQKSALVVDWRWSWSNRWDVIRPWETGTTSNKESSAQKSKSANSKAMNSTPQGPTPLKKGSVVGLAKKRHLVTNSTCKRSFGALGKNPSTSGQHNHNRAGFV